MLISCPLFFFNCNPQKDGIARKSQNNAWMLSSRTGITNPCLILCKMCRWWSSHNIYSMDTLTNSLSQSCPSYPVCVLSWHMHLESHTHRAHLQRPKLGEVSAPAVRLWPAASLIQVQITDSCSTGLSFWKQTIPHTAPAGSRLSFSLESAWSLTLGAPPSRPSQSPAEMDPCQYKSPSSWLSLADMLSVWECGCVWTWVIVPCPISCMG